MSVIFNPKIDKVNSVVNQESVSLPEKIPNPTGQIEASPAKKKLTITSVSKTAPEPLLRNPSLRDSQCIQARVKELAQLTKPRSEKYQKEDGFEDQMSLEMFFSSLPIKAEKREDEKGECLLKEFQIQRRVRKIPLDCSLTDRLAGLPTETDSRSSFKVSDFLASKESPLKAKTQRLPTSKDLVGIQKRVKSLVPKEKMGVDSQLLDTCLQGMKSPIKQSDFPLFSLAERSLSVSALRKPHSSLVSRDSLCDSPEKSKTRVTVLAPTPSSKSQSDSPLLSLVEHSLSASALRKPDSSLVSRDSLCDSPEKSKTRVTVLAPTPSSKSQSDSPLFSLVEHSLSASPLRKRHSSLVSRDSLFDSPEKSKIRVTVLAPTPSSKSRRKNKECLPVFSGCLPSCRDTTFSTIEKNTLFDPEKVYRCGSVVHNLVKQAGSKSCGAAAILMLYTDIVRQKGIPFKLSKGFWEWYKFSYLFNAEVICRGADIHTNLKENNFKISFQKFEPDVEKRVSVLETCFKDSGLPVITAITHPKLGGHWILIDAIEDKYCYIRDPSAGTAHKISVGDLSIWLGEDPGDFVFCKKAD